MENESAAGEQPVLLRDRCSVNDVAAGAAPAALTSPQRVREILKARAARRKFFNEQLFADPAWDMLLELYALKCEDLRISVSKLSHAAGVGIAGGDLTKMGQRFPHGRVERLDPAVARHRPGAVGDPDEMQRPAGQRSSWSSWHYRNPLTWSWP